MLAGAARGISRALQTIANFRIPCKSTKAMERSFYAVRIGRRPGVYNSWDECRLQVQGFPDAEFRKFKCEYSAAAFLSEDGGHVGPGSSNKDSGGLSPCTLLPAAETPVTSKKRKRRRASPTTSAASLEQSEGERHGDDAFIDTNKSYDYSSDANSVNSVELLEAVDGWKGNVQENRAESTNDESSMEHLGQKSSPNSNLICPKPDQDNTPKTDVTYVVFIGKQPGLYSSWKEAKANVEFFPGNLCRKYKSKPEAAAAYDSFLSSKESAFCDRDVSSKKKADIRPKHTDSVKTVDGVQSCELTPLKMQGGYSTIILQFDGGSRGNPGLSGAGAVLMDSHRNILLEVVSFIGEATNNIAEYEGLIRGLEEALKFRPNRLLIEGDSNIVCQQVEGRIKCKNPELKKRHSKALDLLSYFNEREVTHIYRTHNQAADKLANEAMDKKHSEVRMLVAGMGPETPEAESHKRISPTNLSQSPLNK